VTSNARGPAGTLPAQSQMLDPRSFLRIPLELRWAEPELEAAAEPRDLRPALRPRIICQPLRSPRMYQINNTFPSPVVIAPPSAPHKFPGTIQLDNMQLTPKIKRGLQRTRGRPSPRTCNHLIRNQHFAGLSVQQIRWCAHFSIEVLAKSRRCTVPIPGCYGAM